MRIALFFGSFNPIHHGHLIIANYVINENLVDQVWFVVTPQNPFKKQVDLMNEYNRLHLVKIAIEGNVKMRASDIEFKMPKPNYTIDTLDALKETNSSIQYVLLLGGDSYQNILRWKEGSRILKEKKLLVYKRLGFTVPEHLKRDNVEFLDSPIIEIAATDIRKKIKEGKDVRYLLPDKVIEEIEKSGLYKNN